VSRDRLMGRVVVAMSYPVDELDAEARTQVGSRLPSQAGMATGSAKQRAVRQHGWLKEEVGGGLVSAASVKD